MFRFTCAPDGGEPFEVVAKSRAIAAWEKAPGAKGRSLGTLADVVRISELVDLAWFAAARAQLTSMDIVTWREQVDVDVERLDDDADGGGPTRATP